MATSPNFNWPEPDNTDLVKNGALAIRTAVNAIDTSLVDLKGGTTGQVLAKATNTDMDFSWVAQDDSNAIQNAIVDAKGDLIAASAADTPARLAVGANDTILVAASGEATGLKWAGGYTTWTPTYTDFTLGNGTVSARYAQIGKLVHCQLRVILGPTSSVAGLITFTLPITASTAVQGGYLGLNEAACLDSGTAQYPSRCALISSTQAVIFALAAGGTYVSTQSTSSTVPFTWTTNDQFLVNFVYEAA